MGCDAPCKKGRYVILCPRCDGTRTQVDGSECKEERCGKEGKWRGYKVLRRCPASYQSADLARAIRAWRILQRFGTWPVAGGTQDQAAGFLAFIDEIERAIEDAEREV